MLKRSGKAWEFESEEVLEDFVWKNLQDLLDLTPLQRQYTAEGEICDILAINHSKQLVIIELKNKEDRYVVQQLTRYFYNLLNDQKLADSWVRHEDFCLIAIVPSIHRHNIIDQKHCTLKITFYTFQIEIINAQPYFCLYDGDKQVKKLLLNPDSSTSDAEKAPLSEEEKLIKNLRNKLDYYVWYRHGYKLGMPTIDLPKVGKKTSQLKGGKFFKLHTGYTFKGNKKFVSIQVPSTIQVLDFLFYIQKYILTVLGIVTPTGRYYRTAIDVSVNCPIFCFVKDDSHTIHQIYCNELKLVEQKIKEQAPILAKLKLSQEADGTLRMVVTQWGDAYESYFGYPHSDKASASIQVEAKDWYYYGCALQGQAYLSTGAREHYQKILEQFDNAIRLDPNYSDALLARDKILKSLEKL